MSDIYNTQTQCNAARVAIRCAPSHPALAPEQRRRSPTGHPPRGEWGGAQGDEWHLGDYRRIPSNIQGVATAASLVRSRVPHQPPLVSLHPWGLGARRVAQPVQGFPFRVYGPHRPWVLGDLPGSGSTTWNRRRVQVPGMPAWPLRGTPLRPPKPGCRTRSDCRFTAVGHPVVRSARADLLSSPRYAVNHAVGMRCRGSMP